MDHRVIYANGDKIEEIADWDIACKRFEWLTTVWPEVFIEKWNWVRAEYVTIAHYNEAPFVGLRERSAATINQTHAKPLREA